MCEKSGDYATAKQMKTKFEEFSKAEQQRQEQNMRIAQEKELLNIENAQKLQFQEFSESWDKYMASYEATAFELIEDMRQKQDHEQQALLDKIRREMKYKPHKDLVTLRN